jgi:hypothetical protein
VLSGFSGFFEHVDIFLAQWGLGMAGVVIVDQLRETQGAGHAGGAAADDDYIGWHLGVLDIGEGLAED